MNIQELIKSTDTEKIDRYLEMARGYPADPDRVDIIEAICELGLTPYQAAKRRTDSGLSARSFKTLYYHAKVIVEDLYEYLGYSASDVIRMLERTGEAFCSPDLIFQVRQGCEDMGIEIVEDIRIRVVKRKVGRNWKEVYEYETKLD